MDDLADFAERVERVMEDDRRIPKRYIRDAENPLDFFRDGDFLRRYRFPKEVVCGQLLELLSPHLERRNRRGLPIAPIVKLMIALRFYATGCFQIVCTDLHSVSQSSVSRMVTEVSAVIARQIRDYIRMPAPGEVANVTQQFFQIARFHGVVGAVDGTHIRIQNPGGPTAEVFRNRKGFFSFNVQVVTDSQLRFLDLVVRRPGSCHDARIFDNSGIKALFEEGRIYGLLVGDSGYPCREYLLTPFLQPSNPGEERYNRSHIRTRNVVERGIGVWKQRFSCLRKGMSSKLQTTVSIICATGVLHIIALGRNVPLQDEEEFVVEDIPNPVLHAGPVNRRGVNARLHFVEQHFS